MTRVINRLNSDQPLSVNWISEPALQVETAAPADELSPVIFQEGDALPLASRLVVLVPEGQIDLNDLAAKIWNLSAPDHCEVFLLTVPEDPDDKYAARESISTLAAAIRSEELPVQIRVDSGGSYLKALKAIIRPGDLLVCYAEMAPSEVANKQRFIDVLASATHLPVVALPGVLPHRKTRVSSRILEALLVVACLATIVAFFGIQVWLDRNLVGAAKTILEIVSVLVEIRLILLWANFHF